MILASLSVWHASIAEMIWTLLGLAGSSLGWANLKQSRKELAALHEMNGNTFQQYTTMRIIAYGHYRNDLFRLSKQVVILVVGIVAMFVPPVDNSQPVSPLGWVITIGLFAIALLIVMASALDRRQREALLENDH